MRLGIAAIVMLGCLLGAPSVLRAQPGYPAASPPPAGAGAQPVGVAASAPVAPASARPGTLPLGTRVPITFLSDPPGYTLYQLLEGGVGAGVGTGGVAADTQRRFRPLCTAPCQLTLTVGGHLVGWSHALRQPRWASVEVPGPGVLRVYPHPIPSGQRWWWHLLDGLLRYGGALAVLLPAVDAGLMAAGEESLVYADYEATAIGGGISLGAWLLYLWLVPKPKPYRVRYVERIRWEPYAPRP